MVHRDHLEAFVELAEHRSLGAAARATGRSRATYLRVLHDLRDRFKAPVLLERARGQRQGRLTPAGEELAQRARALLGYWGRWEVATRDAISRARAGLRVGALAGSFDLIADLLADLVAELGVGEAQPVLRVRELPDDGLLRALAAGEVDLAFGTLDPEGPPPRVETRALGELNWAVILPADQADSLPARVRLADLDGRPMVVPRAGPARESLEREFAEHEGGPLVLDGAYEVGSTPRMVELVARGLGPAIVSRFRLAFLPEGVVVRPLLDGPAPLTAGVHTRRGYVLPEVAAQLIERARQRFRQLASGAGPSRGRRRGGAAKGRG
jgi:DNA-binding transcriptional LysR family regulator